MSPWKQVNTSVRSTEVEREGTEYFLFLPLTFLLLLLLIPSKNKANIQVVANGRGSVDSS